MSMANFKSSIGRGKFHKIPQQLQTDFLAFLGMKLRGEDVVAPNRRGEGLAVTGAGGDDG